MSRQVSNPENPSEEEQIILTLNEFDDFYTTDNTLHENREGALVAQFITSQAIADWLIQEYPDTTGGEPVYIIPDWVCLLAVDCAILKCPFLGNPVCELCVAVVIVSVIERLVF
ncbi:MAG: hypothetical protein ACE5K8_02020 [Candidatus Zixiibacteriota bacterium]